MCCNILRIGYGVIVLRLTLWKTIGKPTGKWENHRKTHGKVWENHRKTHGKMEVYPLVKLTLRELENHHL